ncbi:hypothetical protein FOA52_007423 [Chlamydomonas sp. UWO 241]|nr:hypothetical protein FOA52_007423 [Chlamydomonas sp. UWO 241]
MCVRSDGANRSWRKILVLALAIFCLVWTLGALREAASDASSGVTLHGHSGHGWPLLQELHHGSDGAAAHQQNGALADGQAVVAGAMKSVPSVRYVLINRMLIRGVRSVLFLGCAHVLKGMPELSKLTSPTVSIVCMRAECDNGKPPPSADAHSRVNGTCEGSDTGDALPSLPGGFDALVVDVTPGHPLQWGVSADRLASLRASANAAPIRLLASLDWGLRTPSPQPKTASSPASHATLMLRESHKGGHVSSQMFTETGDATKEVFTQVYSHGAWEGGNGSCGGGSGPGSCPNATVGVRAQHIRPRSTYSARAFQTGGWLLVVGLVGLHGAARPGGGGAGSVEDVAPRKERIWRLCRDCKIDHAQAIMTHLIRTRNVASILDAPCGSFVWARLLLNQTFPEMKYTGVDVACNVINRHQFDEELMAQPNWQFHCADVTQQQLPPADMVFSRDAMQHLPIKPVMGFLDKVKSNGAKWLAIGSYPRGGNNWNIGMGGYYLIDLVRPPFNLTGVVQVFSEDVWAQEETASALAKSSVPGEESGIPGMPPGPGKWQLSNGFPAAGDSKFVYLVDVRAMAWAPEAEVDAWLAARAPRIG